MTQEQRGGLTTCEEHTHTHREVFLEFGYPRWMVPIIGVMQGAVAVANFHDNGVRVLGGAAGALCCTICSCAASSRALSSH